MADKTAQELCEAALRKIRAIDPAETPDATELDNVFEEMLRMLKIWVGRGLYIASVEEDTHTLTAGTASYTIGSGATIDTDRPARLHAGCFVRANGIDYPLKLIGENRYARYQQKSTGSDYPSAIYYKSTYPNGVIYLWPPGGGELHIFGQKHITEPAAVTNDLVIPAECQDPVVWNLVERISPEFIGDPTPYILAMAKESFDQLQALNEGNDPAELDSELTLLNQSRTSSYDIDGG